MKIGPDNSALEVFLSGVQRGTSVSDAKEVAGAVQPVSAVAAQSATVNLTSMSTLRIPSDSDIDTAKVESIKAALRDGSYKIDAGKIADGMLASARDLMQTRSR